MKSGSSFELPEKTQIGVMAVIRRTGAKRRRRSLDCHLRGSAPALLAQLHLGGYLEDLLTGGAEKLIIGLSPHVVAVVQTNCLGL